MHLPKLMKRKLCCLLVTSRVIELLGLVRWVHIIAPGKAEGPRLGDVGGSVGGLLHWLGTESSRHGYTSWLCSDRSGGCSNISFPTVCVC